MRRRRRESSPLSVASPLERADVDDRDAVEVAVLLAREADAALFRFGTRLGQIFRFGR